MNKLVFSSFKSNNFNYQIGIDSKFENGEELELPIINSLVIKLFIFLQNGNHGIIYL